MHVIANLIVKVIMRNSHTTVIDCVPPDFVQTSSPRPHPAAHILSLTCSAMCGLPDLGTPESSQTNRKHGFLDSHNVSFVVYGVYGLYNGCSGKRRPLGKHKNT